MALLRARAEVQQSAAPAATEASDSEEPVPPGCSRYTVELPKPLGLVLEEGPRGSGVFVVSRRPHLAHPGCLQRLPFRLPRVGSS